MSVAGNPRTWSRLTRTRRTAGHARQMVVAGRRETAAEALSILEDGGNGCDAIVAAALVTAVVDPANVALGGSGYLLLDGEAVDGAWSVEFPARAPARASDDMFEVLAADGEELPLGITRVQGDLNRTGAMACGIPALAAGLIEAHARWGRLPFGRVVEPAIRHAYDGFAAHAEFQLASLANLQELRADPGASDVFLADGLPYQTDPGHPFSGRQADRVLQPRLGRTLEVLAGSQLTGWRKEVGPRLVADVRERGGILRIEDLAEYRPDVGRPYERRIGDARFFTTKSPSGGWTVLQLLALARALEVPGTSTALATHRFVEASRHAFADRYAFFGDPPEVTLETLLAETYLNRIAGEVSDSGVGLRFDDEEVEPWIRFAERPAHRPPGQRPGPRPVGSRAGDQAGTAHLLVGDSEGTLASCTITAGDTFGSKVVSESTGVLLDNAMLWFDARPGFPNSIAPGKRPLTNMAPVIVRTASGARWAAGAPGGRRIPSAVAQVLLRALEGACPQDAVDAPRVDGSGRQVLADADLDESALEFLREVGQPTLRVDLEHAASSFEFARPSLVFADPTGGFAGGFDARCEGYVAGIGA